MDPITKMGCAHTIGQGCLDIISNNKKGPAHFWMTFGVVICEKKHAAKPHCFRQARTSVQV